MAYMGTFKARGAEMGDGANFKVTPDGVATFPIGAPTFTSDQSYPDVGTTSYSNDTGLGITTTTTPSEGFSKVDSWLETYFLDAPPSLTAGTASPAVEYLQVSWTNPSQKKLAFLTTYVPQISHIKADIVPSASNVNQDWSSASAWTVVMDTPSTGKPTCTSLKVVLDYASGSSSLASGTYSLYGSTTATRIIQQTPYDIRVYADNESGKTPRYIYFYNQATLPPGTPAAPSGLTVGSVGQTSALADWSDMSNADRDVNSTATPLISQYEVNVTATGSLRYGGALTNQTTPQLTALASGSDATSQLTLSTLNPGTDYSITVQAKNVLNASFGAASSPVTFTTTLPTAPSWPASTGLSLSNQASLIYGSGAGGYTLDGSTSKTPILNYNTMITTPPRTSTVSSFRLNYTVGDTSASIGSVEAHADATGSESTSSLTTVGFGKTFTAPTGNDVNAARLYFTSEGDAYSGSSAGFYKKASVYAEAIGASTYYPSSDSAYDVYLKFIPTGGSTVTTNAVSFYVDALNSLPIITAAGITAVSSSTSYVTGVPTYTSSATFSFQTIVSNLAYRFLRSDLKHLTAAIAKSDTTLLTSALTVTKTSMDGTTHSYYDAPAQTYALSSSKHNTSGTTLSVNPGSIQFNDFTITLSSAGSVFDENLQLRCTAYNLQGSSSTNATSGRVSTSDGTANPLRIDTVSVTALSGMSGTLMGCGSGQYPSSGYTSALDHSVTIVGTDQLQLVNGKWSTPGVGNGYKNYAGYYFPGSLSQPNYSVITSSGYRYVCIKFTNLKGSGTYDSVTFGFSSSGLTMTPASDSANFRMYMQVVSTTSTVWASCTASINPSGWNAISTDGAGCIDNSAASISSGTGSVKCFVPTATPYNSTIYLRIGLDMSATQSISNITCTAN